MMEKDRLNLKFLLVNTTSLIQPIDQGPIVALKKRYMSSFFLAGRRAPDLDLRTSNKKWHLLNTLVRDQLEQPEELLK